MSGKSRKPRLMIVDDDLDMLPLYEIIGDIPDTIITVQKGGLSALKWLHDLNYEVDAVVLDLSMPDMDGITLTKQIRQNESLRSKATPISVFWFTGWPYDDKNPLDPIVIAANETGVRKIYTKPIEPVLLVEDVKRQLAITG